LPRDLSSLVVIFDLDGTLVDSAPDLTDAMNAVLAQEGMAPLPEAEVRHLVGEGARALLRRGFAEHGRTFPDGEAGDALVGRYLDHYEGHLTARSRLFPGAEACLDALAASGAKLAVCTNKVERLALPVLDQLGVLDRFAVVLGRDSLPKHKPDPAPLLEIARRTRRRGVMVGDTDTDIAAAAAAGMPCFLARFGYGEPEEGAAVGFDGFEALPKLIEGVYPNPPSANAHHP
jgi:phosphoglycolate phosphatase